MKKWVAISMAAALAIAPACVAEGRGDLIIDRNGDGVEDIGYRTAAAEDFVGDWADRTSQRAYMTVLPDDGHLFFTVHWGSSAEEATVWQFSGNPDKDGVVTYTDGVIMNCIFNEEDEETVEVLHERTNGCVAIDTNGMIYWVDSETEESHEMEFEYIPD